MHLGANCSTDGKVVSRAEFFNNPGPNATANGLYYGLSFASDGMLYAAQGNADSIAVFSLDAGVLTQVRTINVKDERFPLRPCGRQSWLSPSGCQPSPKLNGLGVRNALFEACSTFIRVTA